jgi:hypothetical protein
MMPLRTPLIAALAATAALAVGAPAAGASAVPIPTALAGFPFAGFPATPIAGLSTLGTSAAGPCGAAVANEGQARTGGTSTQACVGAGLSFIGPQIGQVATVIGPTIITPAFVGVSIVSGGNVAIGP